MLIGWKKMRRQDDDIKCAHLLNNFAAFSITEETRKPSDFFRSSIHATVTHITKAFKNPKKKLQLPSDIFKFKSSRVREMRFAINFNFW
jgi:hypothetical protein